MAKQRILLPDILKGVAVIFMIQVHIMKLFATTEVLESFAGKLTLFFGGPPAAPVFMAVMGFFIATSNKKPTQDLQRGFKLIGLGFLLNIGMNIHVLTKIFTGALDLNPWHYLFGVDILFLAGLSIILLTSMKYLFGKKLLPFILLSAIAAFIHHFLPVHQGEITWITYFQSFFWGEFAWSYFPFLPWIIYPTVGFIFRIVLENYQLEQVSSKGLVYFIFSLLIILWISLPMAFDVPYSLTGRYYQKPFLVAWVLLFLLFWVMLFKYWTVNRSQWPFFSYLAWVGENVTVFYVFQWLIIGNLATAIYRTQHGIMLVLWFIAILIISSFLVFIWKKLSVSRKRSQSFVV
ncbi:MAG: DUF1624 domain-containing protein [Bacteroidales bacterium]|nr:DUF1624 domain-containing protein [Bacteroidales bacterium]